MLRRAIRRGVLVLAAVLLLSPMAACGDDDDEPEEKAAPITGTFVGKVSSTNAFVAVAAAPAAQGQDRRQATVFVCDGRRLCEWFSGTLAGTRLAAKSVDGDAAARGKLSEKAVTGTLELTNGETVRFRAGRATAAAGLYDLKVSGDGELTGASEAGVALKGDSSLPRAGSGTLELADGTRLKFVTREASSRNALALRAGSVRLIVLPDGKLTGAGKTRRTAGGRAVEAFYVRSAAG